jgi:hypothetical protein
MVIIIYIVDLIDLVAKFDISILKLINVFNRIVVNDAQQDIKDFWSVHISHYVSSRTQIYSNKQICKQQLVASLGNPRFHKQLHELELKAIGTNIAYANNLETLIGDLNVSLLASMRIFLGKLEYGSMFISQIVNNMLVVGDSLLEGPSHFDIHDCIPTQSRPTSGERKQKKLNESHPQEIKSETVSESHTRESRSERISESDPHEITSDINIQPVLSFEQVDSCEWMPLDIIQSQFSGLKDDYQGIILTFMKPVKSGYLRKKLTEARTDSFNQISSLISEKIDTLATQAHTEKLAEEQWIMNWKTNLDRIKALNC